MKTIGLLGGMSWESSVVYYRLLNESVRDRLGGLHSARCVMYSVDFAEIEALQAASDWARAGEVLAQASKGLLCAGAECIVLCTNTMHRVVGAIEESVTIPVLHVADATAEAVRKRGLSSVGLLGTRYTMEGDFYKGRLEDKHGIRVVVPEEREREVVHRVIYDELCLGRIHQESRRAYQDIVEQLTANGAEAVILGCTEIGLLLEPNSCEVPLFDTTTVHARAAVDWALR
ncbi:MAG: aspartate/glutamate racemase family protein [Deltaproteobacteria bacterium]|nr:aspartate/glutamate racemase family protein [Deltaproteobacteria bacterium]